MLRNELNAADDLACIIPDLALLTNLPACELLHISFDKTSNRNTLIANDIALLVEGLANEDREVNRFSLGLLRLFITLSVTNHGAPLINDVSIFINSTADQLLRVAFNDDTDDIAVLILDLAILDNDEALEASESALLIFLDRDGRGAADDVALVVPELTLRVGSGTKLGELLRVALDQFTDDDAVGVDDLTSLVDSEAIEDRERR